MLPSARRDAAAARRFFTRALRTLKVMPSEVVTDAAPVYPAALDGLLPPPGTTSSSTRTIRGGRGFVALAEQTMQRSRCAHRFAVRHDTSKRSADRATGQP